MRKAATSSKERVTTPKGFKEAYNKYVEGGWTGLACDPQFGGQGLTSPVNFAVEEMICSANLSFGLFPGLTHGAYNALRVHATDALKQTYLPKMVSGQWSGTMCLTEPQCGTDLGLIKTRAEPAGDGSFKIHGTKIFISAGEHDLTENIMHLVLAQACLMRRPAYAAFRFLSAPNSCRIPMARRARETRSLAARLKRRWVSRLRQLA